MLETEYHRGQVKDTPIIDWRQALEHIQYLLSRIKELEEAIESVKAERDWDAKEMALTELYKVLEK